MSETQRRIKANDLYALQRILGLEVAPNGEHVAYAVQWVDRESEKKYSNLWMVATQGGEPRQFTVGKHSDTQPHWSPDGQQLAFVSNRQDDKPSQIYLIPVDGGEARALTTFEGEIQSFAWSPDGTCLVCQMRKKDKEALAREEDEKKKERGIVYRDIHRVRYSLDGYGYFPKERWHVGIVDVATGEMSQVTDGDTYDEVSPCWSPDGEWIAFLSNHSPEPDLAPDVVDVYIIPAKGGKLRQLETPLGAKRLLSWSPDGQWLAYVGHEGRGDWWKNDHIWVVPVNGEGAARDVMTGHDLTVSSFTLNDISTVTLMPPQWSRDSDKLYVQINRHGSTYLYAFLVESGEAETVIGSEGVVGAYSLDDQQETLVYFYGEMFDPGQIWAYAMQNRDPAHRLTNLNRELLDQIDLGDIEEVWFEGNDNNPLQGWIIKPPDFDPQRTYPSILEIHGGPLGQYGNLLMHEFFYLAAKGYVVYFCNPRGGIGYGEEHAGAIWGQWGTKDYEDVMAWTDYVAQKPYIDEERMGVTGGSYGGYMTAWIIGHTNRFAAAVAQRSVTNLISMWGASDGNWIFQQPFGDRPPYETIEVLWEGSPIKHIGTATTPTLVIHSENDMRCPLDQSQQLFVALKTLGIDTRLILFPGEPHGLSRIGRTDKRVARLKHIRRWFDDYLTA